MSPKFSNNKRNGQRKGRNNARVNKNSGYREPSMALRSTVCKTLSLGVPKRMNTTFRMALQGYLPAAAPASGQALVYSNSFHTPFASSNPLTSGWSALSLTNGSSTTAVLPGTAFYSAGFTQYRVKSASLKVTAITGTNGDCMNIWIQPVVQNNAVATTYLQAQGQAGFVGALVPFGCRPISIRSAPPPWQVLGYETLKVYETSNATLAAITANPSSVASTCWQVSYATMDGTSTTGQSYFDFEIELNVDFFIAVQQNV